MEGDSGNIVQLQNVCLVECLKDNRKKMLIQNPSLDVYRNKIFK